MALFQLHVSWVFMFCMPFWFIRNLFQYKGQQKQQLQQQNVEQMDGSNSMKGNYSIEEAW